MPNMPNMSSVGDMTIDASKKTITNKSKMNQSLIDNQ